LKSKIIAGIFIIVIVSAIAGFAPWDHSKDMVDIKHGADSDSSRIKNDDGEAKNDGSASGSKVTTESNNMPLASEAAIVVDIDGAVANPGIIELAAGSRVYEAIGKAGGLSKNADTSSINQAAVLYDGDKIFVPSMNNSVGTAPGTAKRRININMADAENLQKINGVGPTTAAKIIEYRQTNGRFKKLEDIMNVSGIGEKTFAKLKDQISLN